jgi:uncharacterized protein involved in oxidation of intracellular sulfur
MVETRKSFVFVINEGPYGAERSYNGLRTALTLAKREDAKISVFLLGDGVQCAVRGQKTPEGYYNIERMIAYLARRGDVAT